MSPESLGSGTGNATFAEAMANVSSFTDNLTTNQGLTAETPPTGESNPAETPPIPEPAPAPDGESTGERTTNVTQGEQNQTNTPEPLPTGTSIPATETKTTATTDTTAESAQESSGEFTKEELDGLEHYADRLESDAKGDLYIAGLIHQFINVASHQHGISHQMPTSVTSTQPASSPKSNAAESATNQSGIGVNTGGNTNSSNDSNVGGNTSTDTEATPVPFIPDAAAAIAEALAETDGNPVPGPATIVTPAEAASEETNPAA